MDISQIGDSTVVGVIVGGLIGLSGSWFGEWRGSKRAKRDRLLEAGAALLAALEAQATGPRDMPGMLSLESLEFSGDASPKHVAALSLRRELRALVDTARARVRLLGSADLGKLADEVRLSDAESVTAFETRLRKEVG